MKKIVLLVLCFSIYGDQDKNIILDILQTFNDTLNQTTRDNTKYTEQIKALQSPTEIKELLKLNILNLELGISMSEEYITQLRQEITTENRQSINQAIQNITTHMEGFKANLFIKKIDQEINTMILTDRLYVNKMKKLIQDNVSHTEIQELFKLTIQHLKLSIKKCEEYIGKLTAKQLTENVKIIKTKKEMFEVALKIEIEKQIERYNITALKIEIEQHNKKAVQSANQQKELEEKITELT